MLNPKLKINLAGSAESAGTGAKGTSTSQSTNGAQGQSSGSIGRNIAVRVPGAQAFNAAAVPRVNPAVKIKPEFTVPFTPPAQPVAPQTTTELARTAIAHLNQADPALITEAITTMRNKEVKANTAINYIARKTMISEVLPNLAKSWSTATKQDFGSAFQMDVKKSDVMDIIVHIGILSSDTLEDELREENVKQPTEDDMLDNRRIVWQHPQPGTQLEPPYVVLVAVEYQDLNEGEDIVQSILQQLVDYQGSKIPKTAREKLP